MSVTRRVTVAVFSLIVSSLCLTQAWAARPAAEELSQREAWVREHFPAKLIATLASAAPAKPRALGLMAWTGDELYSDQGIWGDAKVTLSDGKEVFISDLPLQDPLTGERSADTSPFSSPPPSTARRSQPAAGPAAWRRHVRRNEACCGAGDRPGEPRPDCPG